MTLACAGFALVGVALARTIHAPFVVPAGESPALGTHFALPLVAAMLGYAALQLGAHLLAGDEAVERHWGRRLRDDVYLLLLFVVVIYVHFHVKMWVPLLNPRSFDATYFAIDADLRPVIVGMRALRDAIASVLPRADVWYELGFFAMFSLSFWFHAAGRRRWHYHNVTALALTEISGALLYLVAPAVGPFVFERGDNALATAGQLRMYDQFEALRAGGVGWLQEHGSAYFTAPLAAMPSLHLAAAFVMAYYAVRARLVIAPFAVVVVCWIVLESVVSRWHYLVDLPAGLALAACAIACTNRLCQHRVESVREGAPAPKLARPKATAA